MFSKRFFFETTWTIESKLSRNDHWEVLYKVSVFYADWKFKCCFFADLQAPIPVHSLAFVLLITSKILKRKWKCQPASPFPFVKTLYQLLR
jgi:hypothetical protein